MTDYNEVVKGKIVDKDSGNPVENAEVKVYDKDIVLNDHLGTSNTDKDGCFEVSFKWSDFKGGIFENRPDIFLKVKNPLTGKTTKTEVYDELKGNLGEDDTLEVMDLGDIPLE